MLLILNLLTCKLVNKTNYNAKIIDIEDKIPDLATTATLNAKTSDVKCEIPSISNLVTTDVLLLLKVRYQTFIPYLKMHTVIQKYQK